jgi:hypothetical protein
MPMVTGTESGQPSPFMPKAPSLEANPFDSLSDPLARTLDQPIQAVPIEQVPVAPMPKVGAQETKRSFWEKLRQFLRL